MCQVVLASGLDGSADKSFFQWVVYDFMLKYFKDWLALAVRTFNENPGHFFTETLAILVIVYMMFQRTYVPSESNKLSKAEEEELIREWKPDPLVAPISDRHRNRLRNARVVSGHSKGGFTPAYGEQYLNFASYNFLDVSSCQDIKNACKAAIEKYGVGSCGPRGFYGTIDVHLKLESDFASWLGTEESILYSDSIACVSSVIPSFSKRGDLIICDESVNHNIITGIQLSKSNVLYFKHNDMDHLEQLLESVTEKDIHKPFKKLNRRFIIVEGLYQNRSDICPLDKIVQLKFKHKFRLILDDSMAIGVLGQSGRGTVDHFGLKASDVDIIAVALDTSIGSVGGMCAGSKAIVDHQRLSGVGYVFSASSPPYTCTAALEALSLIDREPSRCSQVRQNAEKLRHLIGQPKPFFVEGDSISPILLIHLNKSKTVDLEHELAFFEAVEHELFSNHRILVGVSTYIPKEQKPPRPSLRVLVSSSHNEETLQKLAKTLLSVLSETLKRFE